MRRLTELAFNPTREAKKPQRQRDPSPRTMRVARYEGPVTPHDAIGRAIVPRRYLVALNGGEAVNIDRIQI